MYRKPTHTDQYLLLDFHHHLDHKQGVNRTLHHQAEKIPTIMKAKGKEFKHLTEALKTCGYPNGFHIIAYVAGVSKNKNFK